MVKRDENIITLKQAIERLLRVYKISNKMDEISIEKEWTKLMGVAISKRTKKIRLENKILRIQLESAVLRHELNFAKVAIVAKLNKQIGKPLINQVLFY